MFSGVSVLLGVDATKINKHPDLQKNLFDKIIFNFPHTGGKMRIEKNRNLLKDFFSSVGESLEPNGKVIITLCNGQGGTPSDNPRRSWNDSWQVVEMAAHGNFILTEIEPFQISFFENYIVTGYRGLEKQFNTQGSLTHFFTQISRPEINTIAPKLKLGLKDFDGTWKNIERSREKDFISDLVSLYPLRFLFDITLFVQTDFCESKFYEVLHNFAGRIIENVEFIGSYEFPRSLKKTRTYRISYASAYFPLYRKRVINIHQEIIARIIEENLEVSVSR